MGLTDDAKKAIDEAIAIVRSDKVHEYIRRTSAAGSAQTAPLAPATDPGKPAAPQVPAGGPTPPPARQDPPPDPPAGRRSAWWGEILDD